MTTARITDEHISELADNGYVVVHGFLTRNELRLCQEEAARYFPGDGVTAADSSSHGPVKVLSFPFDRDVFNRITVHPEILSFLRRSYGTSRLRLGESALQAKYGARFGASRDQTLHTDTWGKKSLAYPRDDGIFRQTFMILYYTDVTRETAPTFIVSREQTRGMSLLTPDGGTTRNPDDHPDLYEWERPVLVEAGTLLIFTGSTLHRGSAMTAETGRRLSHFITYHAAHATWMESVRWPSGDRPRPDAAALRRYLEGASPYERELVGFPGIDDPYWNAMTLQGMALRYPGMDLAPYRAAAEERSR